MNRSLGVVIASFLSAITCGVTFMFARYRQLASVEVAASIATGVEVYFLSSSIAELLEERKEPNRWKMLAAMALAAAILGYFLVSKFTHS